MARDRGLLVDLETDELEMTLLERRRSKVLASEGYPLECAYCDKPARTETALRDRPGLGVCSPECERRERARVGAKKGDR